MLGNPQKRKAERHSTRNSVMKRKYGLQLQSLPRITMVIKGYEEDTKHKAAILEEEVSKLLWDIQKFAFFIDLTF